MLIAAANPCPCGYAGERERCSCGEADLARHARKLSGPLLERIDILAVLRGESHIPDSPPLTSSAQALERILAAREHQAARLAGEASLLNAHAGPSALRRGAQLTPEAEAMLARAGAHGLLSARGQVRVLRTARTIADLEDSAAVLGRHIGAALALRPQTIAFRAAA
jgi:magnesium chelatase family protein